MKRYCYVFHGPNIDNDPQDEDLGFKDEPIEDTEVTQSIKQMTESGFKLVGYFELVPVEGFESLGCRPLENMRPVNP